MAPPMPCPFCGHEMRRGWVRLNGLGLSPLMSSVWWVPGDKKAAKEQKRKLLSIRRMNHRSRACSSCGAVVLDPHGPGVFVMSPCARARRAETSR